MYGFLTSILMQYLRMTVIYFKFIIYDENNIHYHIFQLNHQNIIKLISIRSNFRKNTPDTGSDSIPSDTSFRKTKDKSAPFSICMNEPFHCYFPLRFFLVAWLNREQPGHFKKRVTIRRPSAFLGNGLQFLLKKCIAHSEVGTTPWTSLRFLLGLLVKLNASLNGLKNFMGL